MLYLLATAAVNIGFNEKDKRQIVKAHVRDFVYCLYMCINCLPRLRRILLPTLICCCYECPENKDAIEQEISSALLVTFIEVFNYVECV